MHLQTWLPLIVFILGALLHSLSDDGGASILAHFGAKWRVPVAALPIAILLFGIADGSVERFAQGADWTTALEGALMTSLATVFGATTQHAMVNKSLPVFAKVDAPKLLMLVAAGMFAAYLSACAAVQKALPYLPTPGDLACVATQVEKGATDPLVIVEACPHLANVAAADLEALITGQLLAKKEAHRAMRAEACGDAGAEAGK